MIGLPGKIRFFLLMLRTFLIHLAWFLLPFALYGLYVHGVRLLLRRRPAPAFSARRMALLAACGMLLVAASLFALALVEGEPTEKRYAPPRYEQGEIVPGRFQ